MTSPRRVRGLALAAIALLALGACTSPLTGAPLPANPIQATVDTDTPSHQITEPTAPPTGGETMAPSGDLASFYDQQLDWGPCRDYGTDADDRASLSGGNIECAMLTVPLDYADPAGQTIAIAVLRSLATGDRIGSVLFNPGGPGVPGLPLVADLVNFGIAPALAERFDFVGFDPRGVGASTPHVTCQTDAERDAARAEGWPSFMKSATPTEIAAGNALSEKFVADCVAGVSRQGVDGDRFLANVGTTSAAKDLDVLRAVLGDEQLTYVGWSYGTALGTQYAEQFPGRTRAMILDGAVDPSLDVVADTVQQMKGFQSAFDDFAQWCASRDGCPWTDAADATAWFQSVAQPLMDEPLTLADGRSFGFSDAYMGTISALYSDSAWPELRGALASLGEGDGAGLMSLADEYYRRDASGHYSPVMESFYAISCMDRDRATTDPDELIAQVKELKAVAPLADDGQPPAAFQDLCSYWPAEPTMTAHVPQVTDLPTVLVISTLGDPATPYIAGVNLADYLDGRLLTVEGTRHAGYLLAGVRCVNQAGNDYLIDLRLPAEGQRCAT